MKNGTGKFGVMTSRCHQHLHLHEFKGLEHRAGSSSLKTGWNQRHNRRRWLKLAKQSAQTLPLGTGTRLLTSSAAAEKWQLQI